MTNPSKRRWPIWWPSLRWQLLLLAVAVVVLPLLFGLYFVRTLERQAYENQRRELKQAARALATALSDRPAAFVKQKAETITPSNGATTDATGDASNGAVSAEDPASVVEASSERDRIISLFSTQDPAAIAKLGERFAPRTSIQQLLALAVEDGARAWVINASGTVVGFHDSFAQAIQKTPKLDARNKRSSDDYAVAQVSRFTSWLVRPILRRFVGEVPTSFREEGAPSAAVIDKSLMGVAQLWQRPSSDGRAQIVAAAQPIWSADNIVGVVIVEESTARAAALRLTALENQLAATFITLLATLLLFALFAAVLANRIRRLAKQTETAIDDHGRVVGRVSLDQRTDEIGQLSANIGNMLDRLRDYNAYLEALAGRLAHELRTPIAVVKSSIENLKYEQPAVAQSVYVTRSQEGIERLSKMVSRLTESSRLERMLSQSEFESTDLVALLKGCVEGYNLAAQARQGEGQAPIERVRFQSSEEQLKHAVVSDAICQLLDKLVDNAQRFAPVDLPVLVLLTTQDDQKPSRASDLRSKSSRFVLKIVNAGPHIPDAVMRNLFRSFSAGFAGGSQVESTDHNRDQSIGKVQSGQGTQSTASPQDNEVHLGLGLYIVRIVAEYHNARLKVSNLSADEIRAVSSVYAQAHGGVSFAVEFV